MEILSKKRYYNTSRLFLLLFLLLPCFIAQSQNPRGADQVRQSAANEQQIQQAVQRQYREGKVNLRESTRAILLLNKKFKAEKKNFENSLRVQLCGSINCTIDPGDWDSFESRVSSFEDELNKKFLSSVRSHMLDRNSFVFFPVMNRAMSQVFWNASKSVTTFDELEGVYGGQIASLSSNIVTGHLSVVRARLYSTVTRFEGANISNLKEVDVATLPNDELVSKLDSINIQRGSLSKMLSNGGELNVKLTTPLIATNTILSSNKTNFLLDAEIQGSLDIPVASQRNQTIDQSSGFAMFGSNLEVVVPFTNSSYTTGERTTAFEFIFGGRIAQIFGTEKYIDQLASTKNSFSYSELFGGVRVNNMVIKAVYQNVNDQALSEFNAVRISVLAFP